MSSGLVESPSGLCLVILGGGRGSSWPPGILADPPTHPPTHPHQKIFPQEKNETYQRGPNLEVDFRYTNFFLATPPPPPRYSINQPLSKGLVAILHKPCQGRPSDHLRHTDTLPSITLTKWNAQGHPPTVDGQRPRTVDGYPPTAVRYPQTAVRTAPTAINHPPNRRRLPSKPSWITPPTAVSYRPQLPSVQPLPSAVHYPPAAVRLPSKRISCPPTAISIPSNRHRIPSNRHRFTPPPNRRRFAPQPPSVTHQTGRRAALQRKTKPGSLRTALNLAQPSTPFSHPHYSSATSQSAKKKNAPQAP